MSSPQELRIVELRELYGMIGSDKVEGARVYNSKGEQIGKIDRLMIDKYSGQIAYAVMNFGGFLGVGTEHFPIPWPMLHYNIDMGGYVADLSETQLKEAPKFTADDTWEYADRAEEDQLYKYYNTPPYWA